MKKLFAILLIAVCSLGFANAQDENKTAKDGDHTKLVVVWSSADVEVAERIALLYPLNSARREVFEEVVFVIWGPSAKLATKNEKIKAMILKMKEYGVVVEACKDCTDTFGVSQELIDMGVDVKYMAAAMTNYVKDGDYRILTF